MGTSSKAAENGVGSRKRSEKEQNGAGRSRRNEEERKRQECKFKKSYTVCGFLVNEKMVISE